MSKQLEVNFAGITFPNPITTASGTFGSGLEYSEFVDLKKLGAVTTKGVANRVLWKLTVVCSMLLGFRIRELIL